MNYVFRPPHPIVLPPPDFTPFHPASTSQFARPASDVTVDDWATSSGSGTLASHIDESGPVYEDFIYANNPAAVAEVALSSVSDPVSSAGHIVRYHAVTPHFQNLQRVKVGLYQGSALIAEWTQTLTQSFGDYTHTLSGAEADAISDYSALRLRFTGVVPT